MVLVTFLAVGAEQVEELSLAPQTLSQVQTPIPNDAMCHVSSVSYVGGSRYHPGGGGGGGMAGVGGGADPFTGNWHGRITSHYQE